MSQGLVDLVRKARTSPHIPSPKHEHSLLIRRDLVKMPKALRAEINDVVVKYTERKLRKDGTLDVAVMATNTLHSPMQRDEVSAENKSASHYIKPLHLVSRDQSDCFALLRATHHMRGSRRNTNPATRHSVMFCEGVASA